MLIDINVFETLAKALHDGAFDPTIEKTRKSAHLNEEEQSYASDSIKFAEAPRAVATALMDLALLDINDVKPTQSDFRRDRGVEPRPFVRAMEVNDLSPLASSHSYTGGILLLADNPRLPGCGCSHPEGSSIFGRGNNLGMKSVGVMMTADLRQASLVMVLKPSSIRTTSEAQVSEAVASVAIDTNGHVSGQVVNYMLVRNMFEYGMGNTDASDMIRAWRTASGLSVVLDFPGSRTYLAQNISKLSIYLQKAAAILAGEHAH